MLKKGFKQLLAEANSMIENISVQDLPYAMEDPETLLVDVRDGTERETEGTIPGSVHASRGLLEFHADPESPAHIEALDPQKRLIVFCGTGGRSALAARTLKEMGFPDVASLAGGYEAWKIVNRQGDSAD